VVAIAELAQGRASEVLAAAYAARTSAFGRIPYPRSLRPGLMMKIAPAVAQAAMDSGVALLRPVADMDPYLVDSIPSLRLGRHEAIFALASRGHRARLRRGREERVLRACRSSSKRTRAPGADRRPSRSSPAR